MVKADSQVHELNILDYNSYLMDQYKNRSIHDILKNFTLIKIMENKKLTIYVCKEVKLVTKHLIERTLKERAN